MAPAEKASGAFRTIGELSEEIGVPQHVLRYWETRFPQLRPMQRAGMRRYYRPADVALVRRIHHLLSDEGYSVRGVQKLLAAETASQVEPEAPNSERSDMAKVVAVREALRHALIEDAGPSA